MASESGLLTLATRGLTSSRQISGFPVARRTGTAGSLQDRAPAEALQRVRATGGTNTTRPAKRAPARPDAAHRALWPGPGLSVGPPGPDRKGDGAPARRSAYLWRRPS